MVSWTPRTVYADLNRIVQPASINQSNQPSQNQPQIPHTFRTGFSHFRWYSARGLCLRPMGFCFSDFSWLSPQGAGGDEDAPWVVLEVVLAGFRHKWSHLCAPNLVNYLICNPTASSSDLDSCVISPYGPSLPLPLVQMLAMVCFKVGIVFRQVF